VFFIGIRQDLYDKGQRHTWPEITHDHDYFNDKEEDQMEMFKEEKKQPYVTVFEAIGDLTNFPLSGANDKCSREAPLGTLDRVGNAGEHYHYHNMVYGKDKHNGVYFPIREVDEQLNSTKNREHYKKCVHCGKYNLVVRSICHSCDQPVLLYAPDSLTFIETPSQA